MTDEELIKRASDQATEIAALRKRVAVCSHVLVQYAYTVVALRQRVAELERGEYICRKCGLRKDADKAEDADF